MAQVTIYMDNNLEKQIKEIAQNTGVSISKFISNVLEKNIHNTWSNDIKSLHGVWDDFPEDEQLRKTTTKDITREEF